LSSTIIVTQYLVDTTICLSVFFLNFIFRELPSNRTKVCQHTWYAIYTIQYTNTKPFDSNKL